MHFFGFLTNAFVNQFTSKQLANFEFHFDPVDFLSISRFAIVDPNLILSGFINFTNLTGGVVNCSKNYVLLPPVLNFDQALELGVTELAECLEDEDFIVMVNRYVFSFVGIALAVIVVATVQIFAFQMSAERQVRCIKEKFFKAVLSKEERWFDTKSSGEISSRFSKYIQIICIVFITSSPLHFLPSPLPCTCACTHTHTHTYMHTHTHTHTLACTHTYVY